MSKYVQWKKTIQENDGENDNKDTEGGKLTDSADYSTENTTAVPKNEGKKASGYESDYIDSSDSGSYINTSGGSDINDIKRCKPSRKNYDPTIYLKEFFLDIILFFIWVELI